MQHRCKVHYSRFYLYEIYNTKFLIILIIYPNVTIYFSRILIPILSIQYFLNGFSYYKNKLEEYFLFLQLINKP